MATWAPGCVWVFSISQLNETPDWELGDPRAVDEFVHTSGEFSHESLNDFYLLNVLFSLGGLNYYNIENALFTDQSSCVLTTQLTSSSFYISLS